MTEQTIIVVIGSLKVKGHLIKQSSELRGQILSFLKIQISVN